MKYLIFSLLLSSVSYAGSNCSCEAEGKVMNFTYSPAGYPGDGNYWVGSPLKLSNGYEVTVVCEAGTSPVWMSVSYKSADGFSAQLTELGAFSYIFGNIRVSCDETDPINFVRKAQSRR